MKNRNRPTTMKQMAKMGNAARNKSLDGAQRKEIARHAAETRWARHRAEEAKGK